MDYRIEAKEAFKVVGVERTFHGDTSYKEIPRFWCEHHSSGDGQYVCGMFGICFDGDTDCRGFSYMIADYAEGKADLPAKFTTKEIPAKTWAIFPIKGAMPKALQDVNTKIWNEWLPNCREYVIDGDVNIEMYSDGDTDSADYYSEIWIPVKKA